VGNSGFKCVGRRIETSSLLSNNIRIQKLNVTVADGLTVDGGVTVTNGIRTRGFKHERVHYLL
jgi:hypothetical protein